MLSSGRWHGLFHLTHHSANPNRQIPARTLYRDLTGKVKRDARSKEHKGGDIKEGLSTYLINEPSIRSRKIAHTILHVVHAARIILDSRNIGFIFKGLNRAPALPTLPKQPTESLTIRQRLSLSPFRQAWKSTRKLDYEGQRSVAYSLPLNFPAVNLENHETEDLAERPNQCFTLKASHPNLTQLISEWFGELFLKASGCKPDRIDVSDHLLALCVGCSPQNHLTNSNIVSNFRRGHSTLLTTSTSSWNSPISSRISGMFQKSYIHNWRGGMKHRAFIAVGSNLGDRLGYIEEAAAEMERSGLRICRFGHVYETSPMYLTDQPSFLNTVCEVETDLEPLELLDSLQSVENSLRRVRIVEKGPRTIDLDILLYDNELISNERLTVPHKLMLDRAFVLKPLCDLTPKLRLPPTCDFPPLESYLMSLERSEPSNHNLPVVSMISPRLPLCYPKDPTRRTRIMTVINLTPDSFSDGGLNDPSNADQLRHTVLRALDAGTDIIDIGGQSTRPDATPISDKEELNRILPAIKLIRSMPEAEHTAISVDTFLASVAKQAIHAGANIINDISAGRLDEEMLMTAAKLKAPVVLMHSRGTSKTMKKMTAYPTGLLTEIADELAERVRLAELAGVRRWRIILDPGIGFAKDQNQNLELLRRLPELKSDPRLQGYPWVVGVSRKGFIGKITGVKQANKRGWGTAAAVTASIQGGVDIVRVHDVAEMSQVVKMADAMFRV